MRKVVGKLASPFRVSLEIYICAYVCLYKYRDEFVRVLLVGASWCDINVSWFGKMYVSLCIIHPPTSISLLGESIIGVF